MSFEELGRFLLTVIDLLQLRTVVGPQKLAVVAPNKNLSSLLEQMAT